LENSRAHSGFKIGHIITYVVLILFFLITVLPLFWMWQAALIPQKSFVDPFTIPKSITFQNLISAWTTGRMSKYMLNSVIVAVPRVSVVLLLSSLAGFAFGKLKFKGKNMFFGFILLGMMIPIQAMIIPIYYNVQRMGLIDTHWSMILPAFGLSMPFACFMMRAFFKELPDEIMESATIDGCGEFKIWVYIMLPLIRPALLSLLVFEFMWSWNDFLIPMLMVYDDAYRTLPLGLMYFFGEYTANQSLIAAGVTICTLPIIVVYTLFQKTFIEGITAGAVKG
jgi:raffinose/stachyose/melibiose transport system permease protein